MRKLLLSLAVLGAFAAAPAIAAPAVAPALVALQDATPVFQDVQYRRYDRREVRRRQVYRQAQRRAVRRNYYRGY